MGTAPYVTIEAPPLSPPANGLLNSAPVIDMTDERWTAGLRFVSEMCTGQGYAVDICSVPDSPFDTSDNKPFTQHFTPFLVHAYGKCSSLGAAASDLPGRARRILATVESHAVESEFMQNQLGYDDDQQSWLQQPQRQMVTPDQDFVDPVAGLAALTRYIGMRRYGQGMIHASPELVTVWSSLNLLYREGRKLYTYTGAIVVPGGGYTGPGFGLPDEQFAYATDVVQVMRGPVIVPSQDEMMRTMNRETNEVTVFAQRIYSVQFNACQPLVAAISLA